MGEMRSRAQEEAIRVFSRNLKDLLLAAAYRCGQLQERCKELAEDFERLGRGEMDDEDDG
jgi:hypothetical protein